MTVKSMLDIEVNQDQFKDFYKLFEEFQARVKDIPGGFGKIGEKAKGNAADFALVSAQAHKISVEAGKIALELQKAGVAQDTFNRRTKESAKSMREMGKSGAGIAGALGSMAAKAGLVVAAIAGVISVADKAAEYAVGGQRKARGVGLNQGQQRAFGLDFGRFVDPSILNAISQSQGDLTNRQWLSRAAGVSYGQAGRMGVDELAQREILRAHDWWQRTPASMRIQQDPMAVALMKSGMSWEDIRRAGNADRSEILAAQRQYATNKEQLAISDKAVQPWYVYQRNKNLAEQRMATAGVNAGVPVMGGAEHLAAAGMKEAGKAAHFAAQQLIKLGQMTGGRSVHANMSELTPSERVQYLKATSRYPGGIYPTGHFAETERKFGLPAGLLNGIYQTESGGGRHLKSAAGALGPFQMMPATLNRYGITNPFGMYRETYAAADTEKRELARYHGDLRKAVAAYNLGDPKLDRVIAKYGDQWEQHLPRETRDYINRVLSRMPQQKTSVVIQNKTGSDMFVTTNALAH